MACALPPRRQPAVDPLEDLGPAWRADGQGVRAGERTGPGHPDRPLAAPEEGRRRQRAAMEQAISFAATACLETCRRQGRRLVLGWTGAPAGVCQGQASVKLLHELLEQLAVMRPATEGNLAELIDALPGTTLRDSLIIIVSTRSLNLAEEAERSSRMATASARNLLGRAILLNASQGELGTSSSSPTRHRAGCSSRGPRAPTRNGSPARKSAPRPDPCRETPRTACGPARRRKGTTVNSYLVYRASLYFLLTVSTAILTVDVIDSRFDWSCRSRSASSPSSPSSGSTRGRGGPCRATWPTSSRWDTRPALLSSTRSTRTS